jgi:predicted RNA-binding protein
MPTIEIQHNGQTPHQFKKVSGDFIARLMAHAEERDYDLIVTVISETD